MRFVVFLGLIFSLASQGLLAQERYLDPIFEEITKDTYEYSKGLSLDVYQGEKDTETMRPVLLLVHGGGFAGGQRNGSLEANFMKDMAQRGYVGVSMSYRLLRKGKGFGCDCPAEDKQTIFLEAAKDVYAASYFLQMQSENIGIDPSKIILIGSSAGAEAVLNAAFMRETATYKTAAAQAAPFAGLVSFAGAVLDAQQIHSNNAIPTMLFHGKKDKLVPYGTAPHHYCKPSQAGYLVLNGSKTIAKKIRKQQKPSQLVKDPKGNHDWANIPYKKPQLIASFISRAVLNGQRVKKRIRIKP